MTVAPRPPWVKLDPSWLTRCDHRCVAAGLKAIVVEVNSERDIDTAFAQFAEQQVDALVISSGVFFNRQLDR